jgi:hypothetical protein
LYRDQSLHYALSSLGADVDTIGPMQEFVSQAR